MQVRVWCLLLILASCTSSYDYIDQFVDELLLSRPEVRELLLEVVQQQQLAARHPEQIRGRSLSRGETQGRFLNSLFLGQEASDPFAADSANFLQNVNSIDQRRCIPRLLCSAVSGIFGPGGTTGAVTPAPPVGPPSPPTVSPPAPPTARPRPPAPPTRPPAPPTARPLPPAPPTRLPAPPTRPPAPPTARPRPPAPPTRIPAPPTARPRPPAPPTRTPAPPTARPRPPAPPTRPPAPPTARPRPPAPPTRPPAPPTARPRPPAPPTARPRPPAPPTARPRPPAPPSPPPAPPAIRPPAPPVTPLPRPPVVRPPAPPVGRPPSPPVGPPAPPVVGPPAPPSNALPPASEPFFQKPANTAAFGPPARSLDFVQPARFDPSSRRVALFAAGSPILAEDGDPFAVQSRRSSSRRGRNELSGESSTRVSGRILFVDSSGPSAAASDLRSPTDADAAAVLDGVRSGRSSSPDTRRGRSGEGRVSGRVRFEDDVFGRSARQDFTAVSRAFSVAPSAPDLPSGGRRSSRSQPDPPSSGRIRFPERRRRKRTVPGFGSFMSVLNTLAQPYSFSPYTTAALEGSSGGPRERCARLYPQCPASPGQGGGDFIDIFNNLNRYVPGGVGALLSPLRVPALDAFLQR